MTKMCALKHNLIGTKSFYKQVVTILLPIIIQNTVTNVVSLVDNVMVGRVGTLPMSAVAIVNQLLFVFYLCIFGGLSGAGIFTAQYHGARDNKGVAHTVRMKFYIALTVVLGATAIFLIFPNQLVGMYLSEGTPAAAAAETLKHGKDYLYIMILGFAPFALSQVYGSTLREIGETKLPMIASIIAIGINVVFNYIFIFGNEGLSFLPFEAMGVKGAAIATVMARYAEMAIVLVAVHKNSQKYGFIKGLYKSFKIPGKLCVEIFKKGAPLMVNEMLWSMGMAALVQCYSVRGIEVVAATNITSTVSNIFSVVYLSMGSAIAIMVGQQLGANKIEEAKTTVWRLLALSVVTCALMGGMLFAASPFVPLMYNTSEVVRDMAMRLMWLVSLYMPFQALSHGSYFALRSGGKTIITLIFDSGFMWLGSYAVAYCIAHFTELDILAFFALVQSIEAVKAIAALVLVKKGIWINNIINE